MFDDHAIHDERKIDAELKKMLQDLETIASRLEELAQDMNKSPANDPAYLVFQNTGTALEEVLVIASDAVKQSGRVVNFAAKVENELKPLERERSALSDRNVQEIEEYERQVIQKGFRFRHNLRGMHEEMETAMKFAQYAAQYLQTSKDPHAPHQAEVWKHKLREYVKNSEGKLRSEFRYLTYLFRMEHRVDVDTAEVVQEELQAEAVSLDDLKFPPALVREVDTMPDREYGSGSVRFGYYLPWVVRLFPQAVWQSANNRTPKLNTLAMMDAGEKIVEIILAYTLRSLGYMKNSMSVAGHLSELKYYVDQHEGLGKELVLKSYNEVITKDADNAYEYAVSKLESTIRVVTPWYSGGIGSSVLMPLIRAFEYDGLRQLSLKTAERKMAYSLFCVAICDMYYRLAKLNKSLPERSEFSAAAYESMETSLRISSLKR